MGSTNVPKSRANPGRTRSPRCEHASLEVLGVSRAATYLRCRCGALLVGQDGDAWVIGTAFQ